MGEELRVDIALRLFIVLSMDRFADFGDDTVIAPVLYHSYFLSSYSFY